MRIHRVKKGESIRSVAAEYGVSPLKLCENNGLSERDRLIEGEELLIILPTRTVNAKRTDTVVTLAERYCVRAADIIAMNPELSVCKTLYEGQPISVKHSPPLFGLGIGNGYYYHGCSEEALLGAMPYLNFITVSAGMAKGDGVSLIFDEKDVLSLAKAEGKSAILRVWLGEIGVDALDGAVKSAALLAGCRGYVGICLAGMSVEMKRKEHVLAARRELMGCDLKLFVECDAEGVREYGEYADAVVLTYDKIHKNAIPDFGVGEGEIFTAYAERYDSLRTFLDLSPFAYIDGKYVTKATARRAVMRGGGRIEQIADGDCLCGRVGRGKREKIYVWESMQNTEKKLKLVSELGYYGISFDIARVPIYELLMFRSMFSSGIAVG